MSGLLPKPVFLAAGGSIAPLLLLLTILFPGSQSPLLPNATVLALSYKTVGTHSTATFILVRAMLTNIAGMVAPLVIACSSREIFRQGLHTLRVSRTSGGYGG
jgi:hypothetical protein